MKLNKKSLLSVSLAALLAVGSAAVPSAVAPAEDTQSSSASENINSAYNLASNIEDGNILHAFNWYFNDVKKYMKDIAAAGYSAVQVSPVQANKGTINSSTYACDWWVTYQPINFEIGNGFGTKADFKAMCAEAEKYGVKIIVDVVANHMAQADGGESGEVADSVIADLRDDPDCWHTSTFNTTDANRYAMTQNTLSGLPDLNTSNQKVQDYVKSLLKECIDYGADGFRFDAAKHIELDTDPEINGVSYASDFWSEITSYARELKDDVFIYGEILAPFGTESANYTQYMRITDSNYGATVRNAAKGSTNGDLESYGLSDVDGSDLVLWVESHDNYVSRESTLRDEQVVLGWGIIGARKDSPALFLVRPEHERFGTVSGSTTIMYDELMGGPGALSWQDDAVVAVNKFKNHFNSANADETLYTDGKQFFVQRGREGIVITNTDSRAGDVQLQTTLNDGTYTDQVTGSQYTVSDGVLSGIIDARSVAVLYTPTTADFVPTADITLNGNEIETSDTDLSFTGDTAELSCTFGGGVVSASVTVTANGETSTATNDDGSDINMTIGNGVDYGKQIFVTVEAFSAAGTITDKYTIVKRNPEATCVAYFDTKGNEDWMNEGELSGIYCYAKDADGNELAAYPGFEMEPVEGTTYLKVELPITTGTVKFNEGPVSTGLDGRTIPATVVNYGSATSAANREAGGFEITGSMIWTNGSWQNYESVAPFKTDCETYSLGDANGDGNITLVDAILINKVSMASAEAGTLTGDAAQAADINADGSITLIDAICVQKYVSRLDVEYRISYPVI